jgi:hypothetical protein
VVQVHHVRFIGLGYAHPFEVLPKRVCSYDRFIRRAENLCLSRTWRAQHAHMVQLTQNIQAICFRRLLLLLASPRTTGRLRVSDLPRLFDLRFSVHCPN